MATQSSLRLVEGLAWTGCRRRFGSGDEPDRARVRQGLDHAARQERAGRSRSRPSRPARSASTSRSASAACRAAASSRSTGRNPRARPTLALHTIAEAQKKGGICAFVDAEHALDPVYARKLGVQPRGSPDLAARHRRAGARDRRHARPLRRDRRARWSTRSRRSTPRAEIEGEMGDVQPGLAGAADEPGAAQAHRLDLAARTRMVIFINQIRMKIGVMFG